MKNNTAKQNANSFQREFSIYSITYPALKEAVEKQGYTVVEFNHIYNEEAVACLIDALNISDAVLRSRGFTYADCNHRVVFIHEDLSDDEKLMVLAHEEGHIYCRHMNTSPIIGQDVQDEYEANEFAHYLLKDTSSEKRKRRFIVCMFLVVIGVMLGVFFKQKHDAITYTESLYITESGAKYHRKDCVYIRDRKDVHRMTLVEFDTGEYEACEVCFPDDQ